MDVHISLMIFLLTFQSQNGLSQSQSAPSISCDEELMAQAYPQRLLSPSYPSNYPNNLHCVIHINAMQGTAIELDFIQFDLEDADNCEKDALVVYDGIDDGQRLIQHSCGPHFAWPHYPDAVRSTSNVITLVFITDGNNTASGYNILFKTVEPKPSIFVLAAPDRNRLHVIRRHSALNYGLIPDGIQSPQAVDYDPVEGYVYFSDNTTNIIGRLPVRGGDTEILHKKQISNPFALRIDIVNRLLYWSDSELATISVSNLEGTQRQTLIDTGLHMPGAIVQEPNRGYIYFTDWGNPAKIEVAQGDGTDRRTLVDTSISSPQSLTIDLDNRVLYWLDTLLDTLQSIDVTGNNRMYLKHFHERDPFALVLDDDGFFFTDEEHGWIEMIEREPISSNGFRVYLGSIREPRGLTLRPLNDYGDIVPYACPRADCDHLCLPKPNNGYICSQVLPIMFNCPTDITQMVPDNVVTWTEPFAYSSKQLSITTTKSNNPGEEFSVGIHHVSYKFEDTLCNTIYCNFTITITAPHMIICPDDIYESAPNGVREVIVWWVPPNDTDGRPATSSTHSPGDSFPLGETVVTYIAAYDNIHEQCNFRIFVETARAEGPVFLNCPSNILKWVAPGVTATRVLWATIELEDKAHIIDENHWMETGGEFFTGFVEPVHLRARDKFGNVADCNFTVEVKVDGESPMIINCPKDISIKLSETEDTTRVDWPEPRAFDNSGNVTLTLSEGPSPGSTHSAGTFTVTYLAIDSVFNTATCTFEVDISVKDDESPKIINCPEDISISLSKAEDTTTVDWPEPRATDNSGNVTLTLSEGPSPGSTHSAGKFTVTYVAKDSASNTATCTFAVDISVKDDESPKIINCPEDISISLSKAEDTTAVDWPEPRATDNSGNVTLTLSEGPSPGSTHSAGKFTVTYVAKDSASNTATCTFAVDISVKDDGPHAGNAGESSSNGNGEDSSLHLIIFGSVISLFLLIILCVLLFITYRCRRKPAREVQQNTTSSLPPEYSYAISDQRYPPPVSSVSFGVSGSAVQYSPREVVDEDLYFDLAAGSLPPPLPPPAYEEEKKVDLSDEKGIPPGYQ